MTTEERIGKLEHDLVAAKSRNRWTLTALLLVAVGCGYNTITAAKSEIKARRFVVVDAQGKLRALLGVGDDGTPELSMSDVQGELRASLHVAADGRPTLRMSDAQGKSRALLGVTADGSSALGIFDAQGKSRAVLGMTADGSSALGIFDAQERKIWSAP